MPADQIIMLLQLGYWVFYGALAVAGIFLTYSCMLLHIALPEASNPHIMAAVRNRYCE